MKNNRGVTLTSLIIYVIGLTIVVGIVSIISTFFYKNVNSTEKEIDSSSQFTKFSSAISKEVNTEDNRIIDCKQNYIIFSDGNQYTYNQDNKSIYQNNIKICEFVDQCDFSYTFVDGKYQIKIKFKAGSIDFTAENNELKFSL